MRVPSLDPENPLEKELATHSSIPASEIPWIEDPGSPWGHKRVGHDLATKNNKKNTLAGFQATIFWISPKTQFHLPFTHLCHHSLVCKGGDRRQRGALTALRWLQCATTTSWTLHSCYLLKTFIFWKFPKINKADFSYFMWDMNHVVILLLDHIRLWDNGWQKEGVGKSE